MLCGCECQTTGNKNIDGMIGILKPMNNKTIKDKEPYIRDTTTAPTVD